MNTAVSTDEASCGCCAAPPSQAAIDNRPGLSAIAYRAGTYASFRADMIAALSVSNLPQLAGLTTRDPSDFTLALIDAWASVGEVVTFYQERYANEAYLRTAVERMSVGFLAGLIGYRPRPGVAACTMLAFQIDPASGAPATTDIPAGTQVQSIPGAGQTPQTFETIEDIEGRPAWNALQPIATQTVMPAAGAMTVYLQGTATNLKPGDGLLIVGGEREHTVTSNAWDFRRVVSVTPDTANKRTLVAFDHGLGAYHSGPAAIAVKVFALRQRASLWGYNAPDWHALTSHLQSAYPQSVWTGAGGPDGPLPPGSASNTSTVLLDTVYPQITANPVNSSMTSWVVLTQLAGTAPGGYQYVAYTELYSVTSVAEMSNAQFLLSGKCTVLGLTGPYFNLFVPRGASLFVQSEELAIAAGPYIDPNASLPSFGLPLQSPGMPSPVEGSVIVLAAFVDGLTAGQTLVLTGQRQHAQLAFGVAGGSLSLTPAGNAAPIPLAYMQVLEVMAPPVQQNGQVWLSLRTLDGQSGTLTTPLSGTATVLTLVPAPASAEQVNEVVTIETVSITTDPADGASTTTLYLTSELANSYYRTSVTLCANVARATHGATVHEVLGNGDGAQTFQTFTLKQSPLTFVAAPNAAGAVSTLAVTVNDMTWQAVPALYGASPTDHSYVTQIADDATTTVEFGDGNAGARLPTGAQNVLATYRIGLGTAGNLAAGALTLLATRPLGVRGVSNPVAATGGGDPELLADARLNAGLTVQTLGRVVSLLDCQNFSQAFAGVGKASADWVWDGYRRTVLITLAAADGSTVDPTQDPAASLALALTTAGDPWIPATVVSYRDARFKLGLSVVLEPDYANAAADVLTAVETALRSTFSFAQRAFGQPVVLSEVIAVAQQVTGVLAVMVSQLYRNDSPPPANPAIVARLPARGAQAPQTAPFSGGVGAELLTLDAGPLLALGVVK
jgi:hypothetical protein